jgi:hypothetical protein
MPLRDHFHPPLRDERHWEGFHSKWANALVDELNENLLPPGYFAEPHVHLGTRVEIDAATFQQQSPNGAGARPTASATAVRAWTPPAPTLVLPAAFPDTFEVQVISTETSSPAGTRTCTTRWCDSYPPRTPCCSPRNPLSMRRRIVRSAAARKTKWTPGCHRWRSGKRCLPCPWL